jgi:hypothetical protein
MKKKPISQREARALQKRVAALESAERDRRRAWSKDWPNGVHLTTVKMSEGTSAVRELHTARKLKHAVVAVPDVDTNSITLYAVRLED